MWFVVLDDVPTLTVNVPVCLFKPFDVALTNVCAPPSELAPTLISNVFCVTLEIANQRPLTRSVARG